MKKIKKVDFFLVGAAKSGSTLVNDLLDQNPSISMLKKECHYFSFKNSGRPLFNGIQDNNFSKSVIVDSDEYNKMIFRAKNSDFIGESSVFNLFYSDAAKNIYDYNKNAKIIIIIRNPINRAYSAYHYLRGKKREMESTFENALNKEDFKIKNSWEPIWYYKTTNKKVFVMTNGVLHHTKDFLQSLKICLKSSKSNNSKVYFLIGLYHLYGRKPFLDWFQTLKNQKVSTDFLRKEFHCLFLLES